MNLWRTLTSLLSQRGRALAHYHTGLDLSRANDNSGAITEFTRVIEMEAAPADLRAMALYNRALSQYLIGKEKEATLDLEGLVA